MTAFSEIKDIPLFRYGVIMADPPWLFENYSESGEKRNAKSHYDCMSIDDIKAMPVGELASRDCALMMWVVRSLLPEALDVIRAWGFDYKSFAFTWAKTTPLEAQKAIDRYIDRNGHWPTADDGHWHMGNGYGTRANSEICLLATTGTPERLNKGVRELIVAPRREHSRKPDEAYDRARRLFAGPHLELFGREEREGWDVFGNEVGKFSGEVAA